MSVEDFMSTYRQSFQAKPLFNPLSRKNNNSKRQPQLGFNSSKAPSIVAQRTEQDNVYGNAMQDYLRGQKDSAFSTYNQRKSESTNRLAKDVIDKSVGNVPTNEWGVVQDKNYAPYQTYFNNNLDTIGEIGDKAVETSAAKARWQRLQNLKELSAGVITNIAPGSSGEGGASKAVALALTAAKNDVPYVWGGNSLTGGVDCSGLVQQVYKRMGINLPRTTYEQAKHGKQVGLGNLLPGDLVFYNTGSSDPNGIGRLSHVAIYIGNGKVVQALNSRTGVITSSINRAGNPVLGIRPW